MPTNPATPDPTPPPEGDVWVIVLAPVGESPVPVGRRVAQVLKRALRDQQLRCLSVSARTPDPIPAPKRRKRTPPPAGEGG